MAVGAGSVPAGYSGTPLARKLGLKENHRVLLVGAPDGWTVEDLPAGVRVERTGVRGTPAARRVEGADVVVAFFREGAAMDATVPALAPRLRPGATLWVAWPRRAAGHSSDITDNAVRAVALPLGLVDVKVAALGEDWSGLRMVWRSGGASGPGKGNAVPGPPVDRP